MFTCLYLRTLPIILCNGFNNLHSCQYRKVPFSPHLHQHLLFVDFFFFLDDCHFYQGKVISHSKFDLHFSNNMLCQASFHVLYGLLLCLVWRNIFLDFLPIFLIGFFFKFWVARAVGIFLEKSSLLVISFASIFSHFEDYF